MYNLSHKSTLRLGFILLIATLLSTLMITGAGAKSPAQSGWTLVWEDNFTGSGQPSATNWNYHVGNGYNPGLAGFDGWGNGEWEWYRPGNCYLSGGNLVMRADYNSSPTTIAGRQWYQFSCRITTDTKRAITYGAIEARINMPSKIGTWPAFWMMGDACDDTSTGSYNPAMSTYTVMASNWASCGEVDIMEHRNTETLVYQNLFWDTRTGLFPWAGDTIANAPTNYDAGNVNAFHTYRLEWTTTQMRWYVDGNIAKTQDISGANQEEFQKPFHLILNLALAGAFTGAQPNQADFPLYMYVDYVRVYQAGGSSPTATPVTASPTPGSGSSQGVENVSSNQARAWYKCSGTCSYVILHYIRPGLVQQNVQMTYNGAQARWEYLITGITAGQVLQYQFTYNDGVQHDTAWYSWTKP